MIIGLTGTYCAGKNLIARCLEARGLAVLDVDKLGFKVIETEKSAILDRFGQDLTGSGGTIDRKLLGERVFGKPKELAALEDIIHPAVNRETLVWIKEQQGKICVINAALLHRSSAFNALDAIIIVEAPLFTRLLRARRRDKLPWAALLRRFRSQKTFPSQYLSGKADIYRVENRGYFGINDHQLRRSTRDRMDEIFSLLGLR